MNVLRTMLLSVVCSAVVLAGCSKEEAQKASPPASAEASKASEVAPAAEPAKTPVAAQPNTPADTQPKPEAKVEPKPGDPRPAREEVKPTVTETEVKPEQPAAPTQGQNEPGKKTDPGQPPSTTAQAEPTLKDLNSPSAMNSLGVARDMSGHGLMAKGDMALGKAAVGATGFGGGGYAGRQKGKMGPGMDRRVRGVVDPLSGIRQPANPDDFNTEQYKAIVENNFKSPMKDPLSTFSVDVDTASYANMRRFLMDDMLPPVDAVRIEEMINYFTYKYPQPNDTQPFSVNTEVAVCPWNPEHRLMLVGLQGKTVDMKNLPPANLVFLLDVSGSMRSPDKLPLLQKAFAALVEQLRPQDKVSIVVYAGASGVVLDSVAGDQKQKILEALEGLRAGGSTAGAAGIQKAYALAKANMVKGGNNRVILATDGDFNVGVSNEGDLVKLIEEKRKDGIFLTVLGFGRGNIKDNTMELLADKGNGNYAYIDSILEAKKVLVTQMGGTLFTIAKDVKLQIEFNPAKVKEYRLIGYENRVMATEDFDNDKKDAGDIGAGHTVTAIYEIVPVTTAADPKAGELRYSTTQVKPEAASSPELANVKLRYKHPKEDTSLLIAHAVKEAKAAFEQASDNLRWAASVAEFGMLIRKSEHKGKASYKAVLEQCRGAKGEDKNGYRAEFIQLVERAQLITKAE